MDITKSTAVLVLGGIAGLVLFPYATQHFPRDLDHYSALVLGGCMFAIFLVIVSDRIVSLRVSRDKLEVQLDAIKDNMRATLAEVKSERVEALNPQVAQAEALLNKPTASRDYADLVQEAEEIGQALALLKQVMRAYRAHDAGGRIVQ